MDEEGSFFGTESLDDIRTNFWNNNDTKFKTSFKNLLTSLTDKSNNVIEMVPRVKEKTEPKEITFLEKLNRLFPEANEKIAEQEEKIGNLPHINLADIFSKIDKGEIPKELNFFVGELNHELENRVRSLDISASSSKFLDFFSQIFAQTE